MGSYSLDKKTNLASIALKVRDLDKMIDFYRDVIGFHLINEENDMAIMGIGVKKEKLLSLISEPDGKEGSNNLTGLYHVAFVFSTREEFALFIKHLMLIDYPIEGKSDHGYSENIYINDPEGNRLSIGWDKPEEKWPVTDGKITGVTKELDIQDLLGTVPGEFIRVSDGIKIGNVHLSVSNLDESLDFYQNVLGFDLKNDNKQTKFLSNNAYHHQIALSEWTPVADDMHVQDNDLGIDHFTFDVDSLESLNELKDQLTSQNIDFYFNKGKKIIGLNDPNGIQIWFRVLK